LASLQYGHFDAAMEAQKRDFLSPIPQIKTPRSEARGFLKSEAALLEALHQYACEKQEISSQAEPEAQRREDRN